MDGMSDAEIIARSDQLKASIAHVTQLIADNQLGPHLPDHVARTWDAVLTPVWGPLAVKAGNLIMFTVNAVVDELLDPAPDTEETG